MKKKRFIIAIIVLIIFTVIIYCILGKYPVKNHQSHEESTQEENQELNYFQNLNEEQVLAILEEIYGNDSIKFFYNKTTDLYYEVESRFVKNNEIDRKFQMNRETGEVLVSLSYTVSNEFQE